MSKSTAKQNDIILMIYGICPFCKKQSNMDLEFNNNKFILYCEWCSDGQYNTLSIDEFLERFSKGHIVSELKKINTMIEKSKPLNNIQQENKINDSKIIESSIKVLSKFEDWDKIYRELGMIDNS